MTFLSEDSVKHRTILIFLLPVALWVFIYFFVKNWNRTDFVFSSHLDLANDELFFKDGVYEKAFYDKNGGAFIYQGRPEWFRSYKKMDTFDGDKKKGIFLVPIKDAVRKLTFHSLPSGDHIILLFGYSDGINNNLLASGTTLKVFLGTDPLLERKIRPLPGYYSVHVPLDQRKESMQDQLSPVIFEISLDGQNQDWTHFYVDGYIQS